MNRIERLDPDVFRSEYVAKNEPVIITGIANRWAAARWTPESFKTAFAGIRTSCEIWDGDESSNDPLDFIAKQARVQETVRDFIEKMESSARSSRKYYCAEWLIFEAIPQLRADIESLDAYMGLSSTWPRPLAEKLRLQPLFWMGPAGVISTLHFDRAHNLFVQLYGRKKWILIPPSESRNLYYPCLEFPLSRLHMSPIEVERPDFERFPLYKNVQPIELTLEPGEMLFIPAGWWHYVRALDPSFSMNFFWLEPTIALTLRKHIYYSLRRRLLRGLRLQRLNPEFSVRNTNSTSSALRASQPPVLHHT
jgi:[protein]-arginine 3-hydroxylase / protease